MDTHLILLAIVYIFEHVDIEMQTEGVNDIQCFSLSTSDIERITDQRLGIIKYLKSILTKCNSSKSKTTIHVGYMQTPKLIK